MAPALLYSLNFRGCFLIIKLTIISFYILLDGLTFVHPVKHFCVFIKWFCTCWCIWWLGVIKTWSQLPPLSAAPTRFRMLGITCVEPSSLLRTETRTSVSSRPQKLSWYGTTLLTALGPLSTLLLHLFHFWTSLTFGLCLGLATSQMSLWEGGGRPVNLFQQKNCSNSQLEWYAYFSGRKRNTSSVCVFLHHFLSYCHYPGDICVVWDFSEFASGGSVVNWT